MKGSKIMYKRFSIIIILITILFITMGCSNSNDSLDIDDFSISYLEINDSIYLVDNSVSITLKAPKANRVLLNIQDYGQNKIENVLEGKKSGSDWIFEYKNKDPFTKEIWLVVYSNGGEKISEKKIITNQDQSYETVFENIIPIIYDEDEEEKINILKQKVNLSILGWLDNEHILAKDKENLFSYDIYTNKKDIMLKDVWNVYANYNKDKVVYENNNGIYIYYINKEKSIKILDMKDFMTLKDLAWSGDGKSIVLNIIENQIEHYYIINFNNDTIDSIEIDINLDLYAIENILYLDNNYLYAIGQIKSENKGEKSNLANYLLSFNIKTKRVRNFTPNAQPMDEIKILSQVNEKDFLVRTSSKTISEEEIASSDIVYILNTQNRTLKKKKQDIDFPYVYSLFSNKERYIYLSNSMQDGDIKLNEKTIILGEGTKREVEILKAIQYYPSNFYWSKSGNNIVFYIDHTNEIYLIEMIEKKN